MKYFILLFLAIMLSCLDVYGQSQRVDVHYGEEGVALQVDGKDVMINGMNWDYFPIGTNYSYSLWNQPDDIVKAALDEEMDLLRNMGVNAVRMYTGVPARWIEYIYEKYGIYTMLNHSFGRYGLTVDGTWEAVTDYRSPKVQELLMSEVEQLSREYGTTPGILLYLLGNENNYGLFWQGAETEDFPDEADQINFIGEERGRPMYRLMNEAAKLMKSIDQNHPVAICNGDLLFLEIIAEECKDVDIYGTNMYRGASFGDAFERVKKELGKPILFTEFGADAFNAISNKEDQLSQAYYNVENWKEIYAHAAGLGRSGVSIGGFTFQFSDGWWKYGQTKNLDVHDNNASWSNGGYERDHIDGENNMNEEWFGICAKGPSDERGLYSLYPRASYYALRHMHQFDPYAVQDGDALDRHYSEVSLMDAVLRARGDQASLEAQSGSKLRLSRLRGELSTFSTGGSLISTPDEPDPSAQNYPNKLGFDHMESYYVGVQANPSPGIRANVEFNIVGNVAQNPINEIFYENRARPLDVSTPTNTPATLEDRNRVQVYRMDFDWSHKMFDLKGFYRTGHYHWGYEGDFFGLYPEANYGPNIDIYNGRAPLGMEVTGKKSLKGLSLAFGPELWWGANPAILAKYSRTVGKYHLTGVFHEDLDNAGAAVSSIAVPLPQTRRATLHLKRTAGKWGVELGGIWAGQPLNGRTFQLWDGQEVYQDVIQGKDNWGGKAKLTYTGGKFNYYMQGSAQGLVANGGADLTRTFTGWKLKDNGSGNRYHILSGATYTVGNLQIAPNFMWQKPIEGPIPGDVPAPGRPRNIMDDPFAVRVNRETVAGELLFTYDPTPGTWMYDWDSDRTEDAEFAVSAGFIYWHLPTTQDAAIGIFADGRTTFAFPGAAPARDLWEVYARIVSKINSEFGFIANLYGGDAQANGSNPRTVHRYGADVRMLYNKLKVESMVKINDWGPYDYHRDFNQTFPLQLALDLSLSVGKPDWFVLPDTRLGMRGTWRSLDQFSPRYCPATSTDILGNTTCDMGAPGFDNGQEWEIRTYLHFNIGK